MTKRDFKGNVGLNPQLSSRRKDKHSSEPTLRRPGATQTILLPSGLNQTPRRTFTPIHLRNFTAQASTSYSIFTLNLLLPFTSSSFFFVKHIGSITVHATTRGLKGAGNFKCTEFYLQIWSQSFIFTGDFLLSQHFECDSRLLLSSFPFTVVFYTRICLSGMKLVC